MAHEIQGDVEVPIQLTKDQIYFCLGLIATNKNLAIACIHFAHYRENPLRPLLTNTDIAAFHAEISALDTEDDKEKRNDKWQANGQILIAVMEHLHIEIPSPTIFMNEK